MENRLIGLSLDIESLCKVLNTGYMSNHLTDQIIRSSTSAALNYGEAQAAESKKDFIHKISIVLKELRETQISLKLLSGSVKDDHKHLYKHCLDECDQLIAIYHKTVMSARSKK